MSQNNKRPMASDMFHNMILKIILKIFGHSKN